MINVEFKKDSHKFIKYNSFELLALSIKLFAFGVKQDLQQ